MQEHPMPVILSEQPFSTSSEQPLCKRCGEVREPTPHRVGCGKPGEIPLCKNSCCPTCGAKLELCDWGAERDEVGPFYWVHVLPLPKRDCAACSKPFSPTSAYKPHQENCERPTCVKARRAKIQHDRWLRRKAKEVKADKADTQIAALQAEIEELRALREAGMLAPSQTKSVGRPKGMTDERKKEARELLRYIEEFIDKNGQDDGSISYAAVRVYPKTRRETAMGRAKKTLKDYRKFVGGQKPA
jgi:hypothetical protein